MARMTAADMMAATRNIGKKPDAAKPAAAPAAASITVPKGGEVRLRRTDNGVLATAVDQNYRTTQEVFVTDPSGLKID